MVNLKIVFLVFSMICPFSVHTQCYTQNAGLVEMLDAIQANPSLTHK